MTASTDARPNIVLILADDLGFSDIGCFGGEIPTPHLDALADEGVRLTQFYNTARCSPARASLLTGLHPHQTGIGVLTNDDGPRGYRGSLNDRCVTIAEVLQGVGYTTAARGKWHLTGRLAEPNDAWPTRRGFDSFYGILAGAGSYFDPVSLTRNEEPAAAGEDFYLTERLGEEAVEFVTEHHTAHGGDRPFFLYLPFTPPHWPLHTPEHAVESYRGVFDDGWDVLRPSITSVRCSSGSSTPTGRPPPATARSPPGPTPPTESGRPGGWRSTPRRWRRWMRRSAPW